MKKVQKSFAKLYRACSGEVIILLDVLNIEKQKWGEEVLFPKIF